MIITLIIFLIPLLSRYPLTMPNQAPKDHPRLLIWILRALKCVYLLITAGFQATIIKIISAPLIIKLFSHSLIITYCLKAAPNLLLYLQFYLSECTRIRQLLLQVLQHFC
jgi:hypothetical protein